MSLQEPYPAAPTRIAKFGFTFYRDGEFHSYLNFHACYAAARFINSVINGQPYTWVNDSTITIPKTNVTIKADSFTEMEKVIEHEDNAEESQWNLSSPYTGYVQMIIGRLGTISGHPLGSTEDNDYHRSTNEQIKKAPQRVKKAPPARKQPSSGIITAAILADELSIDPRHLRAALRKAELVKPEGGWQWDRTQANTVIEQIKKFLK